VWRSTVQKFSGGGSGFDPGFSETEKVRVVGVDQTGLQRSPIGRVESFRSWSSHLFRGRPGGRRHVRSRGPLSDNCKREKNDNKLASGPMLKLYT